MATTGTRIGPSPEGVPRVPLGPTGMNLRPQDPRGRHLSKRGGFLAVGGVGLVVGLIIFGIFNRQDSAGNFGKRAFDADSRVTGAKDAGKTFSNPLGTTDDTPDADDKLDPPPMEFIPRRDGKAVAVRPGGVNGQAQRARLMGVSPGRMATGLSPGLGEASQSNYSNAARLRGNGVAEVQAGWQSPNAGAWAGPDGSSPGTLPNEAMAVALARAKDREREAMESGTGINGAGGSRMAVAQAADIGALGAGLTSAVPQGAGPRVIPLSGNSISGAPMVSRDPDDDDSQASKEDFLRKARKSGASNDYVQSTRMKALSAFEIKVGWNIPAVLEQEINSDLPGEIRALVRENVYDTASGRYLLIPQGSRLVGTYDSKVAYAQSALLVVWQRIIFPDASSIDLEGMASQDAEGRSGARGKVNNHYPRLFGTAALSTAFAAAAVVAQSRRQQVLTVPSSQDVAASAASSEISRLGAAITRKNLNVQPTIRILTGTRFSVRVHRDLLFEAPYRPYIQGRVSLDASEN